MNIKDYYVDSSGKFKELKNANKNGISLKVVCGNEKEQIPLMCLSMVSSMKKQGARVKTISLAQNITHSIGADSQIFEWFHLHQSDVSQPLSTTDKSFIQSLIFTGHRVIIALQAGYLSSLIDGLND